MSKARIIVVEDEGIVALQIKEGLISAGYEVLAIADSGKEALKIVADTEPDLVLMDIHLKGSIDGIQAAAKIKEIYNIPVIYLTAFSDDATVERAKKTEPYGYILKPVSERSLELAIEMTLQKAKKEKQLKNNASWYSSIIKGIGQGIIVIGCKGEVKFLNPFAETLTGWTHYDAGDKLYKKVFTLCSPDTKELIEIPFDEIILENKIIKEKPCLFSSRDNKDIPLIYSLIPLQNPNKNIIGIIVLLTYKGKEITLSKNEKQVIIKEVPIEKSILPQNGEIIQGILVHWYYNPDPCPTGDTFNFFSLGENFVGFYIFDVSYYGLTSALFSHNLSQFLSPDSDSGGILTKPTPNGEMTIVSPAEVVNELNQRFFFEEKDNPFFTLIYGITQIQTGKTKIVRAGHPYPIYQKNDGEATLIKSEGGAVGMFADIQVTEYMFNFDPGSRLFLYSDGLIDSSFADMNQTSFKRLITFIEHNADNHLKQVILNLQDEEKRWHKELPATSQITFVGLQRE